MNATLSRTEPSCQANATTCRVSRPRTDIYETDDAWMLVLELPGVGEQAADISVEKNVLSIKAQTEDAVPEGFERVHAEFLPRYYQRSFRLPDQIDRGEIKATVKNGVLSLIVPKTVEARPYQVAVKAG